MRINDDLSRPATMHAAALDWVPSPAKGVDRKMLYRVGAEVARATSIVRYAPGSAFPEHVHGGGEEILVLSGTFQDEHGDYAAGSYFRNPPGTVHSPATAEGCEIFVRLWQFREGDNAQIVRQPGEGDPIEEGLLLFDDGTERVTLEDWSGQVTRENPRGLELLVLSGELQTRHASLNPLSWHRLPAGHPLTVTCGPEGARVWLKDAPLQHPDVLTLPE